MITDFLRGRSNEKVKLLESLLEEGTAHMCEITYAEICFGAADIKQYKQYAKYFLEMPFLRLKNNWPERTAEMGFSLRKSGRQPFLADLLIGLTAIEHDAILLTHDQDFEPFKKLFGMRIE